MYCKNCGLQVDDNAKFCPFCGERLEEKKVDDATKCFNCGADIKPGQKYCNNCGVNLELQNDSSQTTGSSYSSQNQNNQGTQNQYYSSTDVPPYTQNSNNSNQSTGITKSKIAAGLLGIFLGGLGVHNFYLGFTGKAIAQLLISVLSCGFLAIASWIWGFVEGIQILNGEITVDANGNPII